MTESAHMILQSQQLLQLLIFLIDQVLSRFLEELFPRCTVDETSSGTLETVSVSGASVSSNAAVSADTVSAPEV